MASMKLALSGKEYSPGLVLGPRRSLDRLAEGRRTARGFSTATSLLVSRSVVPNLPDVRAILRPPRCDRHANKPQAFATSPESRQPVVYTLAQL